MALRLIIHTFRMIFGNFGQALRISVGPFLILMLCVGLIVGVFATTAESTVGMNPLMSIMLFLMFPLMLFVTAWVAVSWHRFILKEEYAGILPAISNRPIWPYVGKVILLSLLMFVISIPILIILSFSVMPMMNLSSIDNGFAEPQIPIFALLVFAAAFVIIGFIGLRLGVSLVGTAVGVPMKFREAWDVTKPIAGTIFGVTILMVLINLVPALLSSILGAFFPIIFAVIDLALSWLTTMVGISILTTIYGHVVEGRPLPD